MTKPMTISPFNYVLQGNAILVLPDEIPEKSKGGITIPRTAKDIPQSGKVIARGPACFMVSVGDKIQYSRRTASIVYIDGKDYNFTTEDKIFYIYDRNEDGE